MSFVGNRMASPFEGTFEASHRESNASSSTERYPSGDDRVSAAVFHDSDPSVACHTKQPTDVEFSDVRPDKVNNMPLRNVGHGMTSPPCSRPNNVLLPVKKTKCGFPRMEAPTAKDPFWFYSKVDQQTKHSPANTPRWEGQAPLNCLNVAAAATIDFTSEIEVPDSALTTVQLRTREQRLDWRDFLCEAVASRKAASLFQLYDTDADPPQYRRPPPSLRPPQDNDSYAPSREPTCEPQCVAPYGAGWFADDVPCRSTPSMSQQQPPQMVGDDASGVSPSGSCSSLPAVQSGTPSSEDSVPLESAVFSHLAL